MSAICCVVLLASVVILDQMSSVSVSSGRDGDCMKARPGSKRDGETWGGGDDENADWIEVAPMGISSHGPIDQGAIKPRERTKPMARVD